MEPVGRLWLIGRIREHLDVGIEVCGRIRIAWIAGEEDASIDRFDLRLDADLFPVLFDNILRLLADRIDGRLEEQMQAHAVLLAHAVGAARPASLVEQLTGAVGVVLAGVEARRILRDQRRWRGQQVAGRHANDARSVQLISDRVAIDRHGECRPHVHVGEEGVLRGRLGALVTRGVRIGEVEEQALDVAAVGAGQLALPALRELVEDGGLDLQVPGVVDVARLERCPSGRGSVAASLELDVLEERLAGVPVQLIGLIRHHVARLEVVDLVRTGTDRLQVAGRVFGVGSDVLLELLLLNDLAERAVTPGVGSGWDRAR